MREYYTLAEVAEKLGCSEDEVLKRTQPGAEVHGMSLSYRNLRKDCPIKVVPLTKPDPPKTTDLPLGFYEIGVFPYENTHKTVIRELEWNESGGVYANMFTRYEPPTREEIYPTAITFISMEKGGGATLETKPIFFEKSDLFISRQELENHCKDIGRQLIHLPPRTPEEIIKEGRSFDKTDKEIAAMIDAELTGAHRLTDEKLGMALPANPETNIGKSAHVQRGKRLRGKTT